MSTFGKKYLGIFMIEEIKKIVAQNIAVQTLVLEDTVLLQNIKEVASLLTDTFQNGGKLLLCGNGGSASDAQHIAAEFSGRFLVDRAPLFAEALHVNGSALTSIANDYGYESAYARMVQAMGRKNDVLIGLSTSGNSPNVVKAMEMGQKLGLYTIAMTGQTGGALKDCSDFLLNMPTTHTPRIQESHILVGHILCELVERRVFGLE